MGIESFLWLAKTFFSPFCKSHQAERSKKDDCWMAGLVEMGPRVMPIALLPLLLDRGQEADSLILSLLRKLRIDGSLLFVGAVLVSTTWAHRLYVVHLWVGSSRTLYILSTKSAHDSFISYSMYVFFFSNPFLYIYIFSLFGSIINLSSRRSAPSNFTHGRSKD